MILRDVLQFADSGTWGAEADSVSGAPVLRSTNIADSRLDSADVAWRVIPDGHRSKKRLATGDILVTASSGSAEHIGKCCVFEQPGDGRAYYFSNFTLRLRTDPLKADPRWLYHWLKSARGRASLTALHTTTSGLRNLSKTLYLAQKLSVPPLAEQQQIAAVLDKADAIRWKRRESVRLLDAFLRSAFLDMFGDPVKHPSMRNLEPEWRIATLDSIKTDDEHACAGGPFGSSLTRADYVPDPGVPVIRGGNLVADLGIFRDEEFVFVSEQKADQLRRNLAAPGDVIFTQRGTLGQVAQIPLSAHYPRYVVSQSQMKLTVNEEIADPTYVVHYFLSPRGRLDLAARSLATGVPHINLSILRKFPIALPPLPLQKRFASLALMKADMAKGLEVSQGEAERLFSSLAERAFGQRGER